LLLSSLSTISRSFCCTARWLKYLTRVGFGAGAEEALHVEDALGRLDVLARRRAAHGRDMHTDLVGDLLHAQRLEVAYALAQELGLLLDDRARDALDRALPLVYRVDEPLGRVDLAAEVLCDLRVLFGFGQEFAIDRRDAQFGDAAALDLELETPVDLVDHDIGRDGRVDDLAEWRPRVGVEVEAQVLDRVLHVLDSGSCRSRDLRGGGSC
jgi:hypothetical protein